MHNGARERSLERFRTEQPSYSLLVSHHRAGRACPPLSGKAEASSPTARWPAAGCPGAGPPTAPHVPSSTAACRSLRDVASKVISESSACSISHSGTGNTLSVKISNRRCGSGSSVSREQNYGRSVMIPVEMATTLSLHDSTGRKPQLALSATIERRAPGLPSVSEIVSVLAVVTSAFEFGLQMASPPDEEHGSHAVPIEDPGEVRSLVVIDYEDEPLIVAGGVQSIDSWRLSGERGPLRVPMASEICALAVIDYEGQPLVVSGSGGSIGSWRLSGERGPLHVPIAGEIRTLAVVEYEGGPLILTGGIGTIESWRLSGERGPLHISQVGGIRALAVMDYEGESLIVIGGVESIRSRWLSGQNGPLDISQVRGIRALAVMDYEGEPLIVTGGMGAIDSWRLSGERGPLHVSVPSAIRALAVARVEGKPLIVTGGMGAIDSWRPPSRKPVWMTFDTPAATELRIRRLSLASPLELVLHLPVAIAAVPPTLGFVLYAIKRLWGFDVEVRLHRTQLQAELLEAEQECRRLIADPPPAAQARVETLRRQLPGSWEMTDGVLSDEDEDL
jgi:hypothetical protein